MVPPWVQRVVDQAVGTALTLAVMAGPAAAATEASADPPAVVAVVRPPVGPVPLAPTEPSTAGPASTPSPEVTEDDARPAGPEPDTTTPEAPAPTTDQHVVAVGENLWVIARAQLVQDGSTPTDREVHAYWIRLIQANALPSGDPDLIHPGQVLTLPPIASEAGP